MGKNERILATLELLRGVILALMTAIFSVFGYLGVLLYQSDRIVWFIIIGVLGVFALFFALYMTVSHYRKLLKHLENGNG